MHSTACLAVGLILGWITIVPTIAAADCGCPPHAHGPRVQLHVHYVPQKPHCHPICGPPPPVGPVFESAAIRRIPITDRRTEFRFRQEAGELPVRPEAAPICNGTTEETDKRFQEMDRRLELLDFQVNKIFEFVTKQQEIMQKLEHHLSDRP